MSKFKLFQTVTVIETGSFLEGLRGKVIDSIGRGTTELPQYYRVKFQNERDVYESVLKEEHLRDITYQDPRERTL